MHTQFMYVCVWMKVCIKNHEVTPISIFPVDRNLTLIILNIFTYFINPLFEMNLSSPQLYPPYDSGL